MLELILRNFRSLVNDIERTIFIFRNRFPPPDFSIAALDINAKCDSSVAQKRFSIRDLMQENILWAVPKKRRSLEKRLTRKYGQVQDYYKLIIPQKDLLVCVHCGHNHKRGYLCKNCYTKVMDETKRMNDRIKEELKLDPVDKEVVVLYQGEKESQPSGFWEGKRIVEIEEERPAWFSRNLLQKTTTSTSDSTDVKPEQLG